ncbi:hypothetical protein EK21DRAFT_83932 [Setomelanomma holmii]|uniref:Uncharacterized protein n=1 Tax=Setomelanomma holmii TaxID=210430 RepID=A0A9P4HMH0_9PLEO|nr:hypothetical protein EK21DRAFT_83932 [Setomelanomma holmii]
MALVLQMHERDEHVPSFKMRVISDVPDDLARTQQRPTPLVACGIDRRDIKHATNQDDLREAIGHRQRCFSTIQYSLRGCTAPQQHDGRIERHARLKIIKSPLSPLHPSIPSDTTVQTKFQGVFRDDFTCQIWIPHARSAQCFVEAKQGKAGSLQVCRVPHLS